MSTVEGIWQALVDKEKAKINAAIDVYNSYPHDTNCALNTYQGQMESSGCTCWKSALCAALTHS